MIQKEEIAVSIIERSNGQLVSLLFTLMKVQVARLDLLLQQDNRYR